MRWNKANLVLFSVLVLLIEAIPRHLELLNNADCIRGYNRGELRKSDIYAARQGDPIDSGSSPQETRTFSQVSGIDKIRNVPMAMGILPLFFQHNINNEKPKMLGYNYDITFPRKEYFRKEYEPLQEDRVSSLPVNAVSAERDAGRDEYNAKSSNTMESFYYNSLSPSEQMRRKFTETSVKTSDPENVYSEDRARISEGYTSVETSTVNDGADTTTFDYPSATEISGPHPPEYGYRYEKPRNEKQLLLNSKVNRQGASDTSEGEGSPSASSLRGKIEFPERSQDDYATFPRVSVRFQSSSFAQDGIPITYDNEANETEPIEYNFAYSLMGDPEFSHEESRQHETVLGTYHVRLPDGRIQLVQYQADQSGYKPRVTYYQTG